MERSDFMWICSAPLSPVNIVIRTVFIMFLLFFSQCALGPIWGLADITPLIYYQQTEDSRKFTFWPNEPVAGRHSSSSSHAPCKLALAIYTQPHRFVIWIHRTVKLTETVLCQQNKDFPELVKKCTEIPAGQHYSTGFTVVNNLTFKKKDIMEQL